MLAFSTLPPLSLYVHFPWCVRKCPYCDFNSHEARGEIPERAYVEALLVDLEQDLPPVWGRPVRSIFFGGGTPSLFSPAALATLISRLRALLSLPPEIEITLEANPGTIDVERFKGFREAGVNRLSIGIQSFDEQQLKTLGRIHGPAEALHAADYARAAGFTNFNLDLMYGLPRQTESDAMRDLNTALALQSTHLSVYQLTIEPNTLFHARPPTLPDDDTLAVMQEKIEATLAQHGFGQYEVSAYAQDGFACRHNLNYWRFGDYLGLGAGAHAKITDRDGVTRTWKVKQPKEYLAKAASPARLGGQSRLSEKEISLEFMLNALRLNEGFETRLFQERTGLPLSKVHAALRTAEERGWLTHDVHQIRPTATGRRFLNSLLELFV
jgi:oxygen-independent coproporphyrinogen-3 oxidase